VRHRFARELRRFEATWCVKASVAEAEAAAQDDAWKVIASGPNWRMETQYRLVRWDDIIAAGGRRPMWQRIPLGLLAFVDFFTGAFWRYLRANWRYAAFFLYPFLLFAALAALSASIGIMVAKAGASALLGAAVGLVSLVVLLHWPGRRLYLSFLFDDWIFSRRYVWQGHADLDARLDKIAREVAAASRDPEIDEIVVIGHSLGAVLAIDLLDRTLRLNPTLGQEGASVALLSVGSSILKIGLHRGARRFRDAVERVASAPGIFWGDYQALSDVMNFYKKDPIAEMGLKTSRGPLVRIVRIRHMLDPDVYASMRYDPLRMHCQFVSGNNRRAAYDYFMLLCGPLSVERQVRSPDGAVSAIGADGTLLETTTAKPPAPEVLDPNRR
jgi:hypothetical protein